MRPDRGSFVRSPTMRAMAVLVVPALAVLVGGPLVLPASATTAAGGDTVVDIEVGGTTYRVHQFTTVGSQDLVVNEPVTVEVLVVAGGGGGGSRMNTGGSEWAGGGGAGGMLAFTETLSAGTYPIVVGDGGAGGSTWSEGGTTRYYGQDGEDSIAFSRTVVGGGGGAAVSTGAKPDDRNGRDGGSGGGGGHDSGAGTGGAGTSDQGNDGGDGYQVTCPCGGGGGGGAGAAGADATGDSTQGLGGDGGAGRSSDITGTVVTYAGGGGGSGQVQADSGSGGAGGGGAGWEKDGAGSGAGIDGTGGGGGGGPHPGGSGIIIVRYALTPPAPPASAEVEPPSLVCNGPFRALESTTCVVTSGPAGVDVLWRARSAGTQFAVGTIVPDDQGSAVLSFVVPTSAVGAAIVVELVDWTAPVTAGIATGPVPSEVDAGAGVSRLAVEHLAGVALLAAVLAIAAVAGGGSGFESRRPFRRRLSGRRGPPSVGLR